MNQAWRCVAVILGMTVSGCGGGLWTSLTGSKESHDDFSPDQLTSLELWARADALKDQFSGDSTNINPWPVYATVGGITSLPCNDVNFVFGGGPNGHSSLYFGGLDSDAAKLSAGFGGSVNALTVFLVASNEQLTGGLLGISSNTSFGGGDQFFKIEAAGSSQFTVTISDGITASSTSPPIDVGSAGVFRIHRAKWQATSLGLWACFDERGTEPGSRLSGGQVSASVSPPARRRDRDLFSKLKNPTFDFENMKWLIAS